MRQSSGQQSFHPPLLAADIPALINAGHGIADGFSFSCAPLDFSFNDLPTVQVTVRRDGVEKAVYKLNILEDAGAAVVFSPLVITWAADVQRDAGAGRRIIGHCTGWIADARRDIFGGRGALLTSGNLTAARAGAPFFKALGWHIISAADAGDDAVLHAIAQRLETAAEPFRKPDDDGISFAYTLV